MERAIAVIESMYTMTLTKALIIHGVHAQNFFKLINEVPSLDESYSRAQRARAEMLADEILDISDDSTDSSKARNQIDARKWAAAKMRPDKFGERIDLNVNQNVNITTALSEAKSRIREVIEIAKPQLVETTNTIVESATGYKPVETTSAVKNDLDKLLD